MDDDRVRSLLLELYEEGAQDPPPMPVPPVADVRAHRPRAGWLLAGGAGLAAAAVVALIFVVMPGGQRSGTSASGAAERQPSAATAAPSRAAAQPQSAEGRASQGGANAAASLAACTPSHLHASYAAGATPVTGQRSVVIILRNTGPRCVLDGYPSVQLAGAGKRLDVSSQSSATNLTPTRTPVQRVELGPGGAAHFVVVTTTCELNAGASASTLTYAIAGVASDPIAIREVPSLQDCAASKAGGNAISVGPFAPGATP